MIRIGFSRHGSRAAIAFGVSAIAATLAIGAVGAFDGTGAATLAATKTQDQTRARDGSCIVDGVTCEPIRDRLHDGSGAATLAATKTQDQTRARDGSCIVDGVTCEPIRDRLHDGTGGGQTRGGGGPRA